MDVSEVPGWRVWEGAETDCVDVLFTSGDYYRPAVVLLLTGSLCFPSSLFFPLLISTAAECCIVGGRKETVQQIPAAGVPARRLRLVFAPVGAQVVRGSNGTHGAETGSAHVRMQVRLKPFFPFDQRGILQPRSGLKSPQFRGDLAELSD